MAYSPEIPEGSLCTYCSATAENWDHVVPVSIQGGSRSYRADQWIVPACFECNRSLGFKPFLTIPDRARFLVSFYGKRYSKLLRSPRWSLAELDELGPSLRASILAAELERSGVEQRITCLKTVAGKPEDYMRPKNFKVPS